MSDRIAVIGSGVSGLVAARELDRAGKRVTLFEASSRIGGHSHTVTVEDDGGRWEVDTGFIVHNDRNYPGLKGLLRELGVETKPAPMTFSVSDGGGGFEWSTRPLGLFAHRHLFDPRYGRMLFDLLRFNRDSRRIVGTNGTHGSLIDFCRARGYSEYFVERLIVPLTSAVWSADPGGLSDFPASSMAEFFDNHRSLQVVGRPAWRSIVGGSQSYVEAIAAPLDVRTSAPVRQIRRRPDGVTVVTDHGPESFDEVVLAIHSDQALAILADPTPTEAGVLDAIPYQRNEVVLHTDASVMPRGRRHWGSWNFHLEPGAERTTVTYWMNALQGLDADRDFLVSLNRNEAIDPAKVIRRMTYDHPVFTTEGIAAQERWSEISGRNRTHYCGAYWGWGFHEDGVQSALRACRKLMPARLEPVLPATDGEVLAA